MLDSGLNLEGLYTLKGKSHTPQPAQALKPGGGCVPGQQVQADLQSMPGKQGAPGAPYKLSAQVQRRAQRRWPVVR